MGFCVVPILKFERGCKDFQKRVKQCITGGELASWSPFRVSMDKVSQLKKNNGYTVEVLEWMSNFSHNLQWMKLLIHAGINVNPY